MPRYEIPEVKNLPKKRRGNGARRRVVFVTSPNAASLEYMGPMQVFDEAKLFLEYSRRSDLAYKVEIVTTDSGPIYNRKGLSIVADVPYHALRGKVDTLIFQAADETDSCLQDKRFINWVAKMSGKVRRVVSICTGSFILAQAGVLEGRRATTHWCACNDFRSRYPHVNLETDPIYTKDGHVYTSAGATAGADLAIALIEEDFGTEFARRVAQGLVMYLRRPGNQAQFSVQVASRFSDEPGIQEVTTYISENLQNDLRVEVLAEQFNMSPRNFTRVFKRQVGVPPGRFVEQCRLEFARQCLEQSDVALSQIARRCGYASADGLRLAFDRHLGLSPRDYRRRFATSIRSNRTIDT